MVHLEQDYLIALPALVVGGLLGLSVAATGLGQRLARWDARATLPLLLAAAFAHLALLPKVELLRVVLFSLYGLALIATVVAALAGIRVWRLFAVLFPAGSIAGYFFFAAMVHEADLVGLIVKLLEVIAMAAALVPVLRTRRTGTVARGSWLALLGLSSLLLLACTPTGVVSGTQTNQPGNPRSITVQLMDGKGQSVGTALIVEGLATNLDSDDEAEPVRPAQQSNTDQQISFRNR